MEAALRRKPSALSPAHSRRLSHTPRAYRLRRNGVGRYSKMPLPRTENEFIAQRLQAVAERSQPDRDQILTR